MFNYIFRFAKRFAILVPGIAVTFFLADDIYHAIDRWLPRVIAIFLTYVLIAYVLVPATIRFIRMLFPTRHIPLYCTTPDGFASDPINIGVEATRAELIHAMKKAGWYLADRRTLHTVLKLIIATLLKREYRTAPFSTLYLFGRSQDIGFQLPIEDDPHHRHHVRFWATTFSEDGHHREHLSFWQKFRSKHAPGRVLWVGAASLDKGIGIIRHNAQITHMIEPDTDAERELIVKQLKKAGLVKRVRVERLDNPYKLINRVWRGHLKADGRIKICELKSNPWFPAL